MAISQQSDEQPMGFWSQIRSYRPTFWLANSMEMIERWAYYGVRTSMPLYIVGAAAMGGLNFSYLDKAFIYGWWAWVQSLLPMFTGGYSDRYGYKKTIGVSIVFKTAGYLLMGTQTSFWGFFAGCMFLATGTGIFKPGVQGLVAHNTSDKNAALGWGLFYQLVNIGGGIGPIMGAAVRLDHGWSWLFYVNTALVALNFLPLLLCKEPEVAHVPRGKNESSMIGEFCAVFTHSVKTILQPRLGIFILIFSGFWLLFNQMFDLMPNFIDQWVDTAPVMGEAGQLLTHLGPLGHWLGAEGMIKAASAGAQIPPDGLMSIDPLAIVLLMIPISLLASRFKPLSAICLGILISVLGTLIFGTTPLGWLCVGGIFVFALGEMLASPRTNDYFASIAPADQKGLYLGYSNVSNAIGWGIGSAIGGVLYQYHGDKITMARNYLSQHFAMTSQTVNALPQEKVMPLLAAKMHLTLPQVTHVLWDLNHPERVWFVFGGIGLVSLVGLLIYNTVIHRLDMAAEKTRLIPQADPANVQVVK
jgi:dipeptide/tripeptide permease